MSSRRSPRISSGKSYNHKPDVYCAAKSKHLPVENVEEPVQSEEGDIVRGQVLNDTHLVEHHDLRNEGNCFKPQREAP